MLRAWDQPDLERETLPFRISRINEQRGAFKNITEVSLVQEITHSDAGGTTNEEENGDNDGISTDDDDAEPKTQRERVIGIRDEMLKQLMHAQMEIGYALDFTSIVLSGQVPMQQVENTISPFLKQTLPLASLGMGIDQVPAVSDKKSKDHGLVSLGWKMQSLTKAADGLLNAATRLEKDAKVEARHWGEVLAIKENGWAICRMPRERHTMCVRYGFAEASAAFRNRGFGALRRGLDGAIDLDLGHGASSTRRLRARMSRNGQIISTAHGSAKRGDPRTTEEKIQAARNALFDEELFDEAYREARTLSNRGVRCLPDAITLPLDPQTDLLINLCPLDEFNGADEPEATDSAQDQFLSIVVVALRILLCHAHRQAYNLRSRPPPPFTDRKPHRPIYSLLRPVLGHSQHRSALSAVNSFLLSIQKACGRAGVKISVDPVQSSLDISNGLDENPNNLPLVERLVTTIVSSLQSTIEVRVPSQSESTHSALRFRVRTHDQGNEIHLDLSSSCDSRLSGLPQKLSYVSIADMETDVLYLLTLAIEDVVQVSLRDKPWFSTGYPGKFQSQYAQETFSIELCKSSLSLNMQPVNGRSNAVWSVDDEETQREGLLEILSQLDV